MQKWDLGWNCLALLLEKAMNWDEFGDPIKKRTVKKKPHEIDYLKSMSCGLIVL